MIFVSFGNPYEDFSRLARAIDEYAKITTEKVIVQQGFTNYDFKYVEHFDFCTKEEINNYTEKAEVLVLQGGWGSISDAIEKGKRIVAVPRIMGIEHNHDQIQLVKKLEQLHCLIGVYVIEDLANKIKLAKAFDFSPLKRGSATNEIKLSLEKWFG